VSAYFRWHYSAAERCCTRWWICSEKTRGQWSGFLEQDLNCGENHRQIYTVCGAACVSSWCWIGSMFWVVRQWMTDVWRLGAHVANSENIAQVENVMRENRHYIFIPCWWNLIWISVLHGVVSWISQGLYPLSPMSAGRQACTCLCPHTHNGHCISVMLEHLQWYSSEGDAFVRQILVGSVTWCQHLNPQKKQQACDGATPTTISCYEPLLVKWGCVCSFDIEGTLFQHFRSCNNTISVKLLQ
jgi:hypothetical protein